MVRKIKLGNKITRKIHTRTWDKSHDKAKAQVVKKFGAPVWNLVWNGIRNREWDNIWEEIRNQFLSQVKGTR